MSGITIKESLEENKESLSLAVASYRAMDKEIKNTQERIDKICGYIGGFRKGGIKNFYSVLAYSALSICTEMTFLETKSIIVEGDTEKIVYDRENFKDRFGEDPIPFVLGTKGSQGYSGGIDRKLFDSDNSTTFKKNYETEAVLTFSDFYLPDLTKAENYKRNKIYPYITRLNSVITSINTPMGEQSPTYSFTSSHKNLIQNIYNEFYSTIVFTILDEVYFDLRNLRESTATSLGEGTTPEDWGIPQLTEVINYFSSLSSEDSWKPIKTAVDAVCNYPEFTGRTSPDPELTKLLNNLSTQFNTYFQKSVNLKNIIETPMQKINNISEATGLRSYWIYWIFKLLERPTSERMSYNGASMAKSTLRSQIESTLKTINLVEKGYKVLSTPELSCVYRDPDKPNNVILVFIAIPCFDSLRLSVDLPDGSGYSVNYSEEYIKDNSEIEYDIPDPSGFPTGTRFSIRLSLTEEVGGWYLRSEVSNSVYLEE